MVILKKKWLAAALAGILLAAAVLSGCASTEKAKRLRFGVAGEGGIYREFGERFAALENETDNGQVELKATAGSAANLRLLAGEYLQLAIAQADLVQDARPASLPTRRKAGALVPWRRCTPRPVRWWCGRIPTSSPLRTCMAGR